MTHPRTQIRNAAVNRLGQNLTPPPAQGQQPGAPTYRTAAGPRVFAGRLMPVEEPELPAIVVHTRDTERNTERSPSHWNGFEQRECILSIVCVAQSFDNIDDDLDDMTEQVEAALQSWEIPGLEAAEVMLQDTSSQDPDFDGSLATGAATIRYAVTYRKPYRDTPNPYVIDGDAPLEQSGAYPGGRITPDGQSGAACPVGNATITANGEELT